ncbi:signal transduction histidine-protein kinase BarA [Lachnospiraceae bacterium]|nr:signal transduction histidine-protein kinase BarA [Lachnospiraceae bacterium]
METVKTNGYLIIECPSGDQSQVLFADNTACVITGLSKEQLLYSNPEQFTENIHVRRIVLDTTHELWILESGDECLCQTAFEQLQHQNAELLQTLRACEKESRAKSSFLSSMSHDIRTPMNAIIGMTSIGLSHIDEKPRVIDSLQKIQTASSHLMSLVNDVLDMSRIASGCMTLSEESFSLADMVHDIAIFVRPQAAQKHQSFEIEIGKIYEENLVGDPLHLRQIFVNIIGNAVKYTQEKGSIHVKFSQHIDNPKPEKQPCIWLDFSCEDNGVGMSPEFLNRIFVPFSRVNNSTINKIEGTGLGMSIVKNLLDCMGGEIAVESEEGKGSRFQLSIPLTITNHNPIQYSLPKGQTVLVAESIDSRAQQIIDHLTEGEINVVHLNSGMETVTWLTEAQYENHMPCALLIGQELTDMAVLDMASHVHQLAGRDFPIIMVADIDWVQIEYRATRAGICGFVPCPLFRSRLFATLSEITSKAQQGQNDSLDTTLDYSQYHILLVEDNELNREIALELLSLTGIQVETAENGLRAVEIFEHSPEGYFDLIFMDIQMPVMNGYDAAKKIRQLSRKDAKSVWIIAMTANAFVEDIRLSREAGMNEHCSKPVNADRLHEILRKRFSPNNL